MARASSSPILRLIRRVVTDPLTGGCADPELLRRFLDRRDESAFEALVRRHGPMVLDVCRGVLPDEADAEDAFQATFLVLARKAGSVRKAASLASWLHGVAYRTACRARREFARRKKHEARAPAPVAAEAADELAWREVRQVVHEELNALSERHRAPLVLCYLQGKTQDEAAALLGLARSTLKVRLERGRTLLRARLVRRGLDPAALLIVSAWPAASSAGVPAALVNTTIKAVTGAGAGSAAVEGLMNAMLMGKSNLKAVTALFLSGGALAAALVCAGYSAPGSPAPREPPAASRAETRPMPGEPRWQERLHLRGTGGGSFGAFSPDGRTMTVVNSKDVLLFLDTATWKERARYDLGARYGSRYTIHTPFSPDGRQLAVMGGVPDETNPGKRRPETTLLDAATGKELHRLPGHSPVFSPAGKMLATVVKDTVRLWDLSTGKELHRLAAGGEVPRAYAEPARFSPDGRYLFAPTKTGKGKLWDVATGKEIATLPGFLPVWSPDSRALVTVSPGPVVRLWDAKTGAARATLEGFSQPGCMVQFAPDGRSFLTSVYEYGLKPDGDILLPDTDSKPYRPKRAPLDVRLWDAGTGKELLRLPGQIRLCRSATFSPDGRTILYQRDASGPGYKMEAVLWDVAAGKERAVIRDPEGVDGLQFTPDGSAVIGTLDSRAGGALRLWDGTTGRPLPSLPSPLPDRPFGYHFSPDGKILALPVAGPGGRVGEPVRIELRVFQWSAEALARETRGEVPAREPAPEAEQQPPPSAAARAMADIEKQARQADSTFARDYAAADTDAAKDGLAQERQLVLAGLVARAREVARAHPEDPAAVEALEFALRRTAGFPDGPLGKQGTQTLGLVQRQFLKAPVMDRLAPWVMHQKRPEAEALLQTVMDSHPLRHVRGRAGYWLAHGLNERAEAAALLRQMPELLERPEVKDRREFLRTLRSTDPEATWRRAEALYERLREDYADVPLYDFKPGDLGPASERALFALRNLAVGKTAPEIEGKDLDGRTFKLSDYRGKVVVLIFCGHWCGPCREMNPHKQSLVERYAGEPFALLEVNSDDDPEEWKEVMKQEGYTWRCWADGGREGPIAKRWNVTGWPTVYVLDERGVIRSKGLRGEPLAKAVDGLVRAAAR